MEQENGNFIPMNDLESILLKARDGECPLEEFLEALMNSELHVPSHTEVKDDGSGFSPMELTSDAGKFVAVFTARERINMITDHFLYCLTIPTGGQVLSWAVENAPEHGLVINPGFSAGLEISADGMKAILRDFGGQNN